MLERFEKKFTKSKDCWLWLSSLDRLGYGRFQINKKTHGAHRVSYELYKGPIPNGMLVCHSCDIPSCVNPEHLFLGTHKDNMIDKMEKDRWRGGTKKALNNEELERLKNMIHNGIDYRTAMSIFNISNGVFYDVKNNKRAYAQEKFK